MMGRIRRRFAWVARARGLCREDGASAVEFALLAPVLLFALLATVDLGSALHQRMTIDHVLRAGAQAAMANRDEADVFGVLEATASQHFKVAGQTGENPIALAVDRYCACPEDKGTAVACSTGCPGSGPTFVYYRLSAENTHKGFLLPRMTFRPAVQVQVR